MESTTVAPNSTVPPKPPELPTDLGAARPGLDAMARSSTGKRQPSGVTRASRRLSRSLIVFCTGVGATLAWQAYGDTARDLIASSWPQLGWLAPVTESLPQTTAAASTALPEVQQLAGAIDSMRQSVDQLATQFANYRRPRPELPLPQRGNRPQLPRRHQRRPLRQLRRLRQLQHKRVNAIGRMRRSTIHICDYAGWRYEP
jgi:hypothetical protein